MKCQHREHGRARERQRQRGHKFPGDNKGFAKPVTSNNLPEYEFNETHHLTISAAKMTSNLVGISSILLIALTIWRLHLVLHLASIIQ